MRVETGSVSSRFPISFGVRNGILVFIVIHFTTNCIDKHYALRYSILRSAIPLAKQDARTMLRITEQTQVTAGVLAEALRQAAALPNVIDAAEALLSAYDHCAEDKVYQDLNRAVLMAKSGNFLRFR